MTEKLYCEECQAKVIEYDEDYKEILDNIRNKGVCPVCNNKKLDNKHIIPTGSDKIDTFLGGGFKEGDATILVSSYSPMGKIFMKYFFSLSISPPSKYFVDSITFASDIKKFSKKAIEKDMCKFEEEKCPYNEEESMSIDDSLYFKKFYNLSGLISILEDIDNKLLFVLISEETSFELLRDSQTLESICEKAKNNNITLFVSLSINDLENLKLDYSDMVWDNMLEVNTKMISLTKKRNINDYDCIKTELCEDDIFSKILTHKKPYNVWETEKRSRIEDIFSMNKEDLFLIIMTTLVFLNIFINLLLKI